MALDLQFTTNYLLGRGKVIISDDLLEWYDLGNAPAFSYNLTVTTLEHKTSREQLRVTDKEVTTDITAEGTITLDTVHPENIRIFLLGETVDEEVQAEALAQSNDLFESSHGNWKYVSDDETGQGNFTVEDNLANVVVNNAAEDTVYVLNKDYRLDARSGLIMVLATGDIPDATVLHIDYDVQARTSHKIAAAKLSKIEKHLRFVGNPATGSIIDIAGWCNLKPEGDFSLISDDFNQFTVNFKFIENTEFYGGLLEHYDYGEV